MLHSAHAHEARTRASVKRRAEARRAARAPHSQLNYNYFNIMSNNLH